MSPPATSVECRVSMSYEERPQSVGSSYCRYSSSGSLNSSASSFNLGTSAASSGNAGEGFGFKSGCSFSGLGQNGSSRPLRSKPRLAKVRRGFGGRSSNPTPSLNNDSSFNPFLPRSSGSDKQEDDRATAREFRGRTEMSSSHSGQCENTGFVFGASSGFPGKNSDRTETKFERTGGESENVCNVQGAAISDLNYEAQKHAGAAKKSGLGEKQWLDDGESLGSASSVSESSCGIKGSWNKEESEERVEFVDGGESVKSDMKGFVLGTNSGFLESANRKKKYASVNRNRRVISLDNKTRAKNNLRVNLEETGNGGFVFGSSGVNLTSSLFSDVKVPEDLGNQSLDKNFVFPADKPVACGIPVGNGKFTESDKRTGNVCGNGKREGSVPEKHPEVNLSDHMKNLYINNKEKGVHADKADLSAKRVSTDENEVFIFGGIREASNASTSEPSEPQRMCKDDSKFPSKLNGSNIRAAAGGHEGQTSSQFFSSGISGKEIPQSRKYDNRPVGTPQEGLHNPSFSDRCSRDGLEKDKNAGFEKFSFVANLDEFNKKLDRGVKSKVHKSIKSTKTRRKTVPKNVAEQPSVENPSVGQDNPQVILDSTECYSPMDYSPSGVCPTTVDCQQDQSAESRPTTFEETKPSFSACPGISSNRCDGNSAPPHANFQETPFRSSPKPDNLSGDAADICNSSHQNSDGTPFHFSSDVGNRTEKFMFTASTSLQGQHSSVKRQQKKYRMKSGNVSSGVSSVGSSLGSTPVLDSLKAGNGNNAPSKGRDKKKSVADQEEASFSYMSEAEKSCDKWRLRGNEAYKNGELSKAEGFYTWGINCIPSGEGAIGSSLQPLVLCYSNRAATKMALGRVREALQDCLMAVSLDPQFLKGQIRAANCYLLLGELEDAMEKFEKCLQSGGAVCLDRQFVLSASDGLQKAQKVTDHINRAVELLKHGTSEAATITLDLMDQGLSMSLYSEKLLELKANALLMLQRYNEAIQTCQQTLDFANKNFSKSPDTWKGISPMTQNHLNVTIWRDHIVAKCYFYQGQFEAALDLLDKQESRFDESLAVIARTIHDLLKHKNAGNEAYQAGKHREAIEHYTSAILRSTESRPFAAVCFGNRAAAYHALGLITDAIADCSLAIALDEKYTRAVSRRAALHEMIRDYKQAASDLERLVSILENRSRERAKDSRSRMEKELRQTITRLSSVEVEAKREIPLDMYLILGANQSDTEAEIKKAYRKAALKHHPDKAAQSLGRGDNDDGRLWTEIADSVRNDSDRLFKIIGEAYAVLSDPEKRTEYDLREELRNAQKESKLGRSASSRRHQSDAYGFYGGSGPSYPFERSNNRRYWQDSYTYRYQRTSVPK